ncbi:hypothetical protein POPTR_001G131500v4 [Populus trichocarpa]|uniref:Uncharacterized protein n=1 Tax=Populus trichocarpa TaxID=3694 RepID=A0ACC0TJX0_POPTR|nr:hypothetical protein BDE02_01G119000 [Populus trichocarpa]KAI9401498.1 hypothetical protein POPTR_001G131500v4 [Populus trichocarpa]
MECTMVAEEPSPKRSIESRLQKRKRSGKIKATVKRLKAEMVEIAEQQKHIREGQKEVREKFEEIEFQCDELKKETFLISQQAASNQKRLNLMFKILKARDENNFHEAASLTQSLRLASPKSFFSFVNKIPMTLVECMHGMANWSP